MSFDRPISNDPAVEQQRLLDRWLHLMLLHKVAPIIDISELQKKLSESHPKTNIDYETNIFLKKYNTAEMVRYEMLAREIGNTITFPDDTSILIQKLKEYQYKNIETDLATYTTLIPLDDHSNKIKLFIFYEIIKQFFFLLPLELKRVFIIEAYMYKKSNPDAMNGQLKEAKSKFLETNASNQDVSLINSELKTLKISLIDEVDMQFCNSEALIEHIKMTLNGYMNGLKIKNELYANSYADEDKIPVSFYNAWIKKIESLRDKLINQIEFANDQTIQKKPDDHEEISYLVNFIHEKMKLTPVVTPKTIPTPEPIPTPGLSTFTRIMIGIAATIAIVAIVATILYFTAGISLPLLATGLIIKGISAASASAGASAASAIAGSEIGVGSGLLGFSASVIGAFFGGLSKKIFNNPKNNVVVDKPQPTPTIPTTHSNVATALGANPPTPNPPAVTAEATPSPTPVSPVEPEKSPEPQPTSTPKP
jgi:hypothetical protein